MKMSRLGNLLAAALRPSLLFLGVTSFVLLLLFFQLGELVPGLSASEQTTRETSATAHALVANPIGLPHKILQFVPQYLQRIDPFWLRAASASLGTVIVACFYFVLNQWYTRRVALLGTLLFLCSGWFLHTARLGTSDIAFTLLFAAVACVVWLQRSEASALSFLASVGCLLALLYLPGMIWFVVPLLFWQAGRIGRFFAKQNLGFVSVVVFGGLAALGPLAWALYQDPGLIRAYFGLPQTFPAPLEILRNLADVAVQVFVRGPDDPMLWLGRLPLIDWFSTVMFVVGAYAYFFKRRLDRTWFGAYVLGVGSLLVAIGGPVKISLLLPFIYLIVTGGVALMLQQWLTVFPRNPVARTLGPVLMTIAVLLSAFYGVNHYFIAWPNAPETKQVFQK